MNVALFGFFSFGRGLFHPWSPIVARMECVRGDSRCCDDQYQYDEATFAHGSASKIHPGDVHPIVKQFVGDGRKEHGR
jgi:hypothetical protein